MDDAEREDSKALESVVQLGYRKTDLEHRCSWQIEDSEGDANGLGSHSLIKDVHRDLKEKKPQVQKQLTQNSFTAIDVFNTLKQVKFDSDDSDNPGVWAGDDQISSYINQAITTGANSDELAYYIRPTNFRFDSMEGIHDVAEHICRREGIQNTFYGYRESLDKPFVIVSNTSTVLAQNPTDVNVQGGSHWISWVLLPKTYVTLSEKYVHNSKYQVFFFDSLGRKTFPEGLKTLLTKGGEITKKTDAGEKNVSLRPFCQEDEINFPNLSELTGQQMNTSDCGWWATYYALMTVYTGELKFLEALEGKKLSAKHLREKMNLQELTIVESSSSLRENQQASRDNRMSGRRYNSIDSVWPQKDNASTPTFSDSDEDTKNNETLFYDMYNVTPKKDEELLRAGVAVNIVYKSNTDNSPSNYASYESKLNAIIEKLCLEWDADVSAENNERYTPLDIAVANGNEELEQFTNSKIIDRKYSQKKSPLHTTKQLNMKNSEDLSQTQTNLQTSVQEESANGLQSQEKHHFKAPKKKGTTGGLLGHFYEIHLCMLAKIRGDRYTRQFYLKPNVNAVGVFDDIVFRYWINGDENNSTAIFLQAKHKEDPEKGIFLEQFQNETGFLSLWSYFKAFVTIRKKIKSKSKDPVCQGDFMAKYIIYTNAILSNQFDKDRITDIGKNGILYTKSKGNKDKAFKFIIEKNADVIDMLLEMFYKNTKELLAKSLVRCIERNIGLQYKADDHLKIYHVFLAKHVIDVKEEIKEDINGSKTIKYREGTIKPNFLTDASYGKLKERVLNEYAKSETSRVKKISLLDVTFKLDVSFGNINICIKKQDNFINKFSKLFRQEVVRINDENVGAGKELSRGDVENIGKLVGNLLVYDKEEKILRFSHEMSLEGDSLNIFKKLKETAKSNGLEVTRYKFDIEVEDFPRMTLDRNKMDENIVKEYLNNLEVFTGQASEEDLQTIIRDHMREWFCQTEKEAEVNFLQIREKFIQYWKNSDHYIDKSNDFYKDVIKYNITSNVKDPVALFTGRKKELKSLHEKMKGVSEKKGKEILRKTCITGLGGIGKTQLARAYIHKYSKYYDNNIIWINAASEATLTESFKWLATQKLRLRTQDGNKEELSITCIVEEVYNFFCKRRCLFVFDNAEKNEYIRNFLPQTSLELDDVKPYILLTSRNREWEVGIKTIYLNKLKEDDAIELVKKGLFNQTESEDVTDSVKSESKDIRFLVEKLNYFPLMLQQAIAYIKYQNKMEEYSIGNYLNEYEEKKEDLLNSKLFRGIDIDYAETTFTTWKITIDKIKSDEKYGKLALKILNTMAYLAPDDIKREMFQTLEGDEKRLSLAVHLLVEYSMVDSEEKGSVLSIHRQVQDVTRIDVERNGEHETFMHATSQVLEKSFPFLGLKQEDYAKKIQLLPHLETFLSHVDHWIKKKPKCAKTLEKDYLRGLLHLLIDGYSDMRNIEKIKELVTRALKIWEKHGGGYTEKVLLEDRLVTFYLITGKLDEAKKCVEKSYKSKTKVLNQDNIHLASHLTFLAECNEQLSEFEERDRNNELAATIFEKQDKKSFEDGLALEQFSDHCHKSGNHQKEVQLLTQALAIEEKRFGEHSLRVALSLRRLGKAYGCLRNYEHQQVLLERAIKIQEKYYGAEHIEVAKTSVNLADAHSDLGNHELKKTLLEKVLPIFEKYYGKPHNDIVCLLVNLGITYRCLGNHEKSRNMVERASRMFKKISEEDQ